jgi:predicted RNA-binding protein with PIN domain
MIILIDGYNFLKSITGTKFINEHQMRNWLSKFDLYVQKRANKILIVFDAGPSFFPSCEKTGSVDVCYAGQYQTADDWIKAWLEKNNQKDILLVSSDREVRTWAHQLGVVSINSQDFYKLFNDVLHEKQVTEKASDFVIYKIKKDEPSDDSLDRLMESAAYDIEAMGNKHQPDEEIRTVVHNKKVSKRDKSLLKKIDKV